MTGHKSQQAHPNPAIRFLESPKKMLSLLRGWERQGWLRTLDVMFADFISTDFGKDEDCRADALLILAAALLSLASSRGHICLDLGYIVEQKSIQFLAGEEYWQKKGEFDAEKADIITPEELLQGIELENWIHVLTRDYCRVECRYYDHPAQAVVSSGIPLVLCGNNLYMRRYFRDEQIIFRCIRERLQKHYEPDPKVMKNAIREVWDNTGDDLPVSDTCESEKIDWQKIACAIACRGLFTVITGGPGTGKTTVVKKIVEVLRRLGPLPIRNNPLRNMEVKYAAPTGKAAARLSENIREKVSTVHRLLGTIPNSRKFKHNATNKLAVDVLILDEASMIGVEMLARVMEAMPDNARLILLGDKDQLASVEAGAVLGQLCAGAEKGGYSEETSEWVRMTTGESIPGHLRLNHEKESPLDQAVVMLRHSYRFRADSGIGKLAAAVNCSDVEGLQRILNPADAAASAEIVHVDYRDLDDLLLYGASYGSDDVDTGTVGPGWDCGFWGYIDAVRKKSPAMAYDDWAREVLETMRNFQVLCAVRSGPYGVEGINRRVERLLGDARSRDGLPGAGFSEWYEGRPVMITANDYTLGLMNGDMGVTLRAPCSGGPFQNARNSSLRLMVAFISGTPDDNGVIPIKWVLPGRLNSVQTVFAMTIHKSQGSQFRHIVMILPDCDNPGMTRELVYTGITRAERWLAIVEPSKRMFAATAAESGSRRMVAATVAESGSKRMVAASAVESGVLTAAVRRTVHRTGGSLMKTWGQEQ